MPQPSHSTAAALVFRGIRVVDVADGQVRPNQTIIIRDNRIRVVGPEGQVQVPRGARVVDARGQYVIPGLWDMHVHPWDYVEMAYPLLLANGITGIRDPGSTLPLATLRRLRQEILAGQRVGPPRQLLAGPSVAGCPTCAPGEHTSRLRHQLVATSPADARWLVDSLARAGADFVKSYEPPPAIYFAMAAEARRVGISYEGHLDNYLVPNGDIVARIRVSADSGQRAFDHVSGGHQCRPGGDTAATLETCRQLAALLRRHDAWLVPTPTVYYTGRQQVERHLARRRYLPDSIWQAWRAPSRLNLDSFYLSRVLGRALPNGDTIPPPDAWSLAERAGLPILLGTDATFAGAVIPDPIEIPGFRLHDALELLVDGGMSPLGALRAATLAPAEYLHAADSLGTVAPGKLADLVVLDRDPLADIRNTTMIRAVVANGRYYDRAALDHLLADAERAAPAAPPVRPSSPRTRP